MEYARHHGQQRARVRLGGRRAERQRAKPFVRNDRPTRWSRRQLGHQNHLTHAQTGAVAGLKGAPMLADMHPIIAAYILDTWAQWECTRSATSIPRCE
jgi:hypothetical protein